MNKKYLLLIILPVVILAMTLIAYYRFKFPIINSNTNETTTALPNSNNNNTNSIVTPIPIEINPLFNVKTGLDYPISNFTTRNSINSFGNYFSSSTPRSQYPDSICPNNTLYTGYHAAYDLETTAEEQNTDVPVYAISDGMIEFASSSSGYGGLIILGFTYQNQAYTALYGHIDVRTIKFTKGQKVIQGDNLASLAPSCSTYSGNNRKHLHFAIHKGNSIVMSGYVSPQSALSNWVSPQLFFGS